MENRDLHEISDANNKLQLFYFVAEAMPLHSSLYQFSLWK
jgi:hypothetical protein